ncbi:hypothetical protein SRHO_G00209410 [Serrasalmus rhombeus]
MPVESYGSKVELGSDVTNAVRSLLRRVTAAGCAEPASARRPPTCSSWRRKAARTASQSLLKTETHTDPSNWPGTKQQRVKSPSLHPSIVLRSSTSPPGCREAPTLLTPVFSYKGQQSRTVWG